jgi:broad specificity phosphatase PhoE
VAEHDRAEGLQREVAKLQDLAEAHKKAIGLLLNKAAEAQLDAAKLRAKLERREEEEPPQESPHEFVVRVRTFGAELLITQGVVSSGHAIQLLSDALGMLISMHGTPVPEGEE